MELKNTEKSPSETAKLPDDALVNAQNELSKPRWSVVSFEKRVASELTYEQAAKELEELIKKKVSGLCIITDEAARRIKN